MTIILGLGNPGPRYLLTRHNMGFRAVDCLSESLKIPLYKASYHAFWGRGRIGGQDVVLAKPMTYMNNCGLAAAALCRAFGTDPGKVLVICDDLDLPAGKIRLRPGGGSGGHNGLKSIIFHLQTENFPRLRIGVGRPADGSVTDYVLEPFTKEEEAIMAESLLQAVLAASEAVQSGIPAAMNRFNQ